MTDSNTPTQSNTPKEWWENVPKSEKPGLRVLFVIFVAIMIFAGSIHVGRNLALFTQNHNIESEISNN